MSSVEAATANYEEARQDEMPRIKMGGCGGELPMIDDAMLNQEVQRGLKVICSPHYARHPN